MLIVLREAKSVLIARPPEHPPLHTLCFLHAKLARRFAGMLFNAGRWCGMTRTLAACPHVATVGGEQTENTEQVLPTTN